MALSDIIRRVERRERRLTLFDPPSRSVARNLARTFSKQGVVVEVREGTSTPVSPAPATADHGGGGTALVRDGDDVVMAVPLDEPEAATDALTDALAGLQRTTFNSYDTQQMVATTREIEDRAWRVGSGRIRAGFQTVDSLAEQVEVYGQLGTRDLDVHAYAAPVDEADSVTVEGVTTHLSPAAEIERSWFVVYDGGDEVSNRCALLAEEREEREERQFTGFWTVDPDLVDEIDSYLAATY